MIRSGLYDKNINKLLNENINYFALTEFGNIKLSVDNKYLFLLFNTLLLSYPNDDKQNYPLYRLKLLDDKFGH